MNCQEIKPLLMGFLDEELEQDERREVEAHLSSCVECREEIIGFQQIEEMASSMKFIEPSEQAWKGYWSNIYNRLERNIGWLFFSIGTIILLGYSAYQVLEEIFLDPGIPSLVKIGIATLGLGLIVLFVSVVRERLSLRKFDKYEEVIQ